MTYPLGYPLASSAGLLSAPNDGPSGATGATKDSAPLRPSPGRLSARRLALIEARLSPRDREVMAIVARFRVMSGGQLQRLFWPEGAPQTRARLARHGLSRLCDLGVLAPLARRVGGVRAGSSGRCFALGIAGQRLSARESYRQARSPHTPGERHLAHTLAVAELYVQLVEAERWGLAHIHAFDAEPACWRAYAGPWGARLTLKPDAFLKIGAGEWAYSWLVEQDMATESSTTIGRKARRHLDYLQSGAEIRVRGVAPRVIWIVPDERRASVIRGVLEPLGGEARKLFAVALANDALAALTGDRS
jgi:hypothetical protein